MATKMENWFIKTTLEANSIAKIYKMNHYEKRVAFDSIRIKELREEQLGETTHEGICWCM